VGYIGSLKHAGVCGGCFHKLILHIYRVKQEFALYRGRATENVSKCQKFMLSPLKVLVKHYLIWNEA